MIQSQFDFKQNAHPGHGIRTLTNRSAEYPNWAAGRNQHRLIHRFCGRRLSWHTSEPKHKSCCNDERKRSTTGSTPLPDVVNLEDSVEQTIHNCWVGKQSRLHLAETRCLAFDCAPQRSARRFPINSKPSDINSTRGTRFSLTRKTHCRHRGRLLRNRSQVILRSTSSHGAIRMNVPMRFRNSWLTTPLPRFQHAC